MKTHTFYVQQHFANNCVVYVRTYVRYRGDNRMRGMRSALRWMTQATDMHSEYVANTYCFSTAKILTRTLFNIKST